MTAVVAPCACGEERTVVTGGYLRCPHCDGACPKKVNTCDRCKASAKHLPPDA